MSEDKKVAFDFSDALVVVCLTALIVLFAGEPDLLDAIIAWVGRQ